MYGPVSSIEIAPSRAGSTEGMEKARKGCTDCTDCPEIVERLLRDDRLHVKRREYHRRSVLSVGVCTPCKENLLYEKRTRFRSHEDAVEDTRE